VFSDNTSMKFFLFIQRQLVVLTSGKRLSKQFAYKRLCFQKFIKTIRKLTKLTKITLGIYFCRN